MLLSALITWVAQYSESDGQGVPAYRGVLIARELFLLTPGVVGMLSDMYYFFIVGMFFTAVVQTMVLHQYFHRCFTTGMRLRAALVTAIYRKTLVLSNGSRQQSTVGEVSIENG